MKNNQRGDIEFWLYGTVIAGTCLVFLGLIFVGFYKATATHRQETFTIDKSERIAESKGGRYLLYTDNGVYENTDSFWNGKFNSSDLYAQIQANHKYNCDVIGWRVPFFSWYPDVLSCKEVK